MIIQTKRAALMKIITYIMVVLFITANANAQNRDSLVKIFTKAPTDTNKVFLAISLGQLFESDDPDSSLHYYNLSRDISEQLKYTYGKIKYANNVTFLYNQLGKYDTALQINLESVTLAKKIKNTERLGACLSNVASSYLYKQQLEQAIAYYLQALEIIEIADNDSHRSVIYSNLSATFFNAERYDKALFYGEKSIAVSRKLESAGGLANALNNTANAAEKLRQYAKADKYYKEALTISNENNLQYEIALTNYNIANLLRHTGKIFEAAPYLNTTLPISKKIGNLSLTASCYNALSNISLRKKDFTTATLQIIAAQQIAEQNKFTDILYNIYPTAEDIAIAQGDFEKAEAYAIIGDSIQKIMITEKAKRNTAELEEKYQQAQKNIVIEKQQAELKENRLYILLLTIGFTGFFAASILLYKNMQKSKKIQQQKLLQIENENKLQLANSKLAVQYDERSRIAKDLHDNMGATLSSIAMYAEIASSKISLENSAFTPIQNISNIAAALSSDLKDIIWFILPENEPFGKLIDRIRQYSEPLCSEKDIQLNISYTPNIYFDNLKISDKKNIYLIIKEAVNNTLKYANAKKIIITIEAEIKTAFVKVQDDGYGLNDTIAYGNGLKNMEARAKELNGSITINGKHGTCILLTIPIE